MVEQAVANPPIAFGPVLSRRLGWSLGINNVRPKACTYACVYCQLGPTDRATSRRAAFHEPEDVVAAVLQRAERARGAGQQIDIATFVPDGEPTLDLGLGPAIQGIRSAGYRVAVITNGSLCWDDEVRDALGGADVVSIKVDTVDEATWHRLNRPLRDLALPDVLEGVRRFAASYRGELLTETMLVAGVNDSEAAVAPTAAFVGALEPLRAYVAVPTRPPTEQWVRAPSRADALRAADAFRAVEMPVTCLLDDLEAPFGADPDAIEGLLGIVSVHPMTEEDARGYLERSGADWSVALKLLGDGLIVRVVHDGREYLRRAPWS